MNADFISSCILSQKVIMHFSLPRNLHHNRSTGLRMSSIITALGGNFAFSLSLVCSPRLCFHSCCHRWQLQTWSTGGRAGSCGDSPSASRCNVSVSCRYIEVVADVWICPFSIFFAVFSIDLWRKEGSPVYFFFLIPNDKCFLFFIQLNVLRMRFYYRSW